MPPVRGGASIRRKRSSSAGERAPPESTPRRRVQFQGKERSKKMRRFIALLAISAATVIALAATASAAPSANILIRHQLVGCHSWSVNGNAFAASQKLVVHPKTMVSFTNNDVMPH